MRCTHCAAMLASTTTDLPFKLTDTSIVILRGLPVLECVACPECLIDDAVMGHVDEILARIDGSAELTTIHLAT